MECFYRICVGIIVFYSMKTIRISNYCCPIKLEEIKKVWSDR